MNSYQVILYLKAQQELAKSFAWYEKQKIGLGEEFIHQIEIDLNLIAENPKHYPKKGRKYREFVMRIYPYLILYEINEEKDEILIASIFHTKRNPTFK